MASICIAFQAGPEAVTLVITGELDLVTAPLLAEQLARALDSKPRRLILDLTGVEFIDCGSARLIAAAGRSLPGSGRPVIRRPHPRVRRLLDLTGLSAYCEIED